VRVVAGAPLTRGVGWRLALNRKGQCIIITAAMTASMTATIAAVQLSTERNARMSIIGRVGSLWRYPVKSVQGEELDEAFVGFPGVCPLFEPF